MAWWSATRIAQAAARCGRRKGKRPDAIAFRMRHGQEVLALSERLAAGRYAPQPGTLTVTQRPKAREIHAAAYRDRVVHHLLHDIVAKRFEPHFIADSYACRVGKGTHAAADGLRAHMRRVTREGGVRAFALQMDIRNFFGSLHKPTLLTLLAKGFAAAERLPPEPGSEPTVWGLLQTVVEHDPVATAQRRGSARDFARVPVVKRLGALGSDRGLPIGNLTSQFFANVYLNALDQFVKRTLGVRHYVRYVDDFVLLDGDPERLRGWEARIRAFLADALRLEAHPVPRLHVVGQDGVDFVGYIVRPDYVLPRRRVVRHMRARLNAVESQVAARRLPAGYWLQLGAGLGRVCLPVPVRALRYHEATSERLRAVWASYDGHLLKADATRLRGRLWADRPVSAALLQRRKGRVTRRYALAALAPHYGAQVRRLRQGLGRALLLVQVGAFVECTTARDAKKLGLRWYAVPQGRRRAGLPLRRTAELVARALSAGQRVALAVESPHGAGRLRARRLALLLWPEGKVGARQTKGAKQRQGKVAAAPRPEQPSAVVDLGHRQPLEDVPTGLSETAMAPRAIEQPASSANAPPGAAEVPVVSRRGQYLMPWLAPGSSDKERGR